VRKGKKGGKESEKSEAPHFREGYYEHHSLNEGRGCTREENDACMEVVKLVLGKKLSEPEGQERIKEILNPEVPF